MLTVYGDESYDEHRQRAFAVAGLIGSDTDWKAIEGAWVARTGGKAFHSATCESEFVNDLDPQRHKDNLKLYADLAKLLAGSNLMGFGATLDMKGWREALAPAQSDKNSAYYKCFSEVVIYFGRIACLSIPPEKVQFIFDRNFETEPTAHELYGLMGQSGSWPHARCLGKISSATIEDPRIQMADLVAREAMKGLDNDIGPVKRPRRRSLQALLDSKRFRFEEYAPEYSQSLVDSARRMTEDQGPTAEQYQAWLRDRNVTDTILNRIKFMAKSEGLK